MHRDNTIFINWSYSKTTLILVMKTTKSIRSALMAVVLNAFSFIFFAEMAVATTHIPAVSESRPDTTEIVAGVPLMPRDVSPLLVGENIPVAMLPDADGQPVNLNEAVARKPTILVFYRGGWCPYCSKQLSGLQEIEDDLMQLGYQVIAVSTDSPENLRQTEEKQALKYTLLSDADLALSKQFGIAYKSPKNYDKFLPETSGGKNIDKLLPVPSVFFISREGNIRFEYINPDITQRLSPALLKAAAAALLGEM